MEQFVHPMSNAASVPTSEHPARSQDGSWASESGQDKVHRCTVCEKTYERRDHLSRHIKSHNETRNHICPDCGKGFHRGDLLTRHRTVHLKDTSADTQRRRTSKACQSCISAKTKCKWCLRAAYPLVCYDMHTDGFYLLALGNEERPCGRCKARNEPCLSTQARVRALDKGNVRPMMDTGMDQTSSVSYSSPATSTRHEAGLMTFQDTNYPPAAPFEQMHPPDFMFFDQIMNMPTVQHSNMHEPLLAPPNVSNFTADDLNLIDFDFGQLARGFTRPSTAQGVREDEINTSGSNVSSVQSNAQLRSEAFDRSPYGWNRWMPNKSNATFSGHEINVTEQRVNADDQLTPGGSSRFSLALASAERDRILRLVTAISGSRLTISSFPSLELLNDLLNVFGMQERASIDSYVHWHSIDGAQTRTETLLGLLAKGATFVALEPVWRIGLVFQEVVRMAIAEMFEKDNSTTRQLQPLQAYMLYLDVGMWSGFRRQTEIATGFLQPAVTMLSWADALTRFRYDDIEPSHEDDAAANDTKWLHWVEQESLKRLVLRTFMHDSQASLAHTKDPLLSPSRMQLPVPSSVDLWQAPDAASWRDCYLSLNRAKQSQLPSVVSIAADIQILHSYNRSVDQGLSTLLACHLIAYDVLIYRQQAAVFANNAGYARRDRWLSHTNRQKEIYEDLGAMHLYCDMLREPIAEANFLLQYLMMLLHTPFDDIQLFSGRSGEAEARRVYPLVKAWTEDAESRTAIWHAGQALRAVRSFEQTKLRDFYCVILHHVALTLWVFGMVTSNQARASRAHTPTRDPMQQQHHRGHSRNAAAHHENVLLDGEDGREARAFRHFGQGRPCLTRLDGQTSQNGAGPALTANQVCPLEHPKGVMQLASKTLEMNFPNSCSGLPPLVDNLVKLMNELAKYSGRDG